MYLKVTRLSRRKNEWTRFVHFPDTYTFRHAVRLLGNSRNGINIKRATIEQVYCITKPPSFYDVKTKKVLSFRSMQFQSMQQKIDELFDLSIEDYVILHKPHQVTIIK